MAGEKLTQIKIRDGQGISQSVPIQVTADQVTYNNGTVGQVIQNLQTNIGNINGKVNINQSGHAGQFLMVNANDQVEPAELSLDAIKAAMGNFDFEATALRIATSKINNDVMPTLNLLSQGFNNHIKAHTEDTEEKFGYNTRLNKVQEKSSQNKTTLENLTKQGGTIENINKTLKTASEAAAAAYDNIFYTGYNENNQEVLKSRIDDLKSSLDTKVNVKNGYNLSKNNFTDGYKAKLDKVHFGSAINTDSTSGHQVFFGENTVTSRIGFWGNKTTKIGIAISNTEDSKRWRLLAQINTGNTEHRYLGLTLQDYDTSKGRKRGDKQVYNTEYFLPGEFFTVSSGTCYSGLITNESKALHFFIPMPRRCDHSNIKSITATFSKTKTFSVRCPGGYLPNSNGSSGPIEMDTNDKKFEFIKKSNGIAVKVTNKDGSKITNINNTNVNVYFTTSFKFTFN